MRAGIVLLGHGSRDPAWHRPMEAVAARIRAAAPDARVGCACLELSDPDLATAVAELVAQGVDTVRVVPMFLGVGRHVREDLPVLAAALRERHPEVPITLMPAVGEHPQLIEALAQIALTAPFA